MSTKETKNTVKQLTAQDPVIQQEPQATETVVYAGESLKRGALQQYSVFRNGIPKSLDEDIEKCPAIAKLMVPISKLAETQRNILLQGSHEHTLNQQIQSYARGGK